LPDRLELQIEEVEANATEGQPPTGKAKPVLAGCLRSDEPANSINPLQKVDETAKLLRRRVAKSGMQFACSHKIS
jgi:hypothetical protein